MVVTLSRYTFNQNFKTWKQLYICIRFSHNYIQVLYYKMLNNTRKKFTNTAIAIKLFYKIVITSL